MAPFDLCKLNGMHELLGSITHHNAARGLPCLRQSGLTTIWSSRLPLEASVFDKL
jgi:hypothetical protein